MTSSGDLGAGVLRPALAAARLNLTRYPPSDDLAPFFDFCWALRADTGGDVDWAALARDLGYADQAHLTRDFTATLGTPPARYAARSASA